MNNDNKQDKKYFKTPQDFMKGIFIVPHNFDNPENDDHAEYVNLEVKHDFFMDAYDRVISVYLFNKDSNC